MPWIQHTHPEQEDTMTGTYPATVNGTSIYHADSGAVMVAVGLQVGDQTLTGHQCLIQKDGTVSEYTLRMCKEALGWDGSGGGAGVYDYLCSPAPQPCAGREVEVVLIEEDYKGKMVTKVQYINAPGGSTKIKPAMDRAAFLAAADSKIRAMTGGTPVKKPTPKSPPAAKPTPPPAPTGPTATMEEAWEECCKANPTNTESAWFAKCKELGLPENNSLVTPQQWGQVKAAFEDNVKM